LCSDISHLIFYFSSFNLYITCLAYLEYNSGESIVSVVSAVHKGKTFVLLCGTTYEFEVSIHEMPAKMNETPLSESSFEFMQIYLFLEIESFWIESCVLMFELLLFLKSYFIKIVVVVT
jgi:hypothetical protein